MPHANANLERIDLDLDLSRLAIHYQIKYQKQESKSVSYLFLTEKLDKTHVDLRAFCSLLQPHVRPNDVTVESTPLYDVENEVTLLSKS